MCIRDSFEQLQHGLLLRRVEIEPATLNVFQEASQQVVAACLLYTSDAADERSSVDLGGRRIIKKKKNEDHFT